MPLGNYGPVPTPADLEELPDGTTRKAMSDAEKTKLSGIEANAKDDQTAQEIEDLFKAASKHIVRTATLVVAANDSSAKSKAQSDYVCPEDDALDYITTTVIPALPANGGSIVLLEGTYTVSTNDKPLEINTKTNIAIIGQGAGTKLCLDTGISSDIIKIIDSSKILIENLLIDGTTIAAGSKRGISFDNVDHSKISKVWSLNNKDSGIYLYNSSEYNEITQSEFSANYDGIYAETACNYNTLANNTIRGNGDCGIYLNDGPSRNTIVGNVVQGNDYGIYLDKDCDHNTFTGNIVQENSSEGFSLNALSYGGVVSGNNCQSNHIGISVFTSPNTTVTGNTVRGSTNRGIRVQSSFNCSVTGNTSNENGMDGIYFNSSSYSTISGNVCKANGEWGITLYQTSHYNTIAGNTCAGNGYDGIRIRTSTHNNITGNTCYDNGKDAAATYDGIRLISGADYNNVQTNLVRQEENGNTHRHGIRVDDNTCDDNLIANNDCYDGGGTNGISDAGTGTLFGSGNRNKDGTWGVVPN